MTENRVIRTAEELDALPEKTIVMDKEGSPYQKHDDAPNWYGVFGNEEWANEVVALGPVTVLHEPKPGLPTTPGSVVRSNAPGRLGQAHVLLDIHHRWVGASTQGVDPDLWVDGWTVVYDAGAANDD
jgi:hypothetical protein